MKTLLITITAILHVSCVASTGGADPFHETPGEYAARARWLRDAKVGVFVHWNPSSVIGQEISWSRNDHGKEKYDQLYRQFKGERFDAGDWVRLFHDSGIRYAVIVTKHHDGFWMFDTKVPTCSEYNVRKVAEGSTIGSKLFLKFTPLKARLFRRNIRKSSDTPTLAEFQLFGN